MSCQQWSLRNARLFVSGLYMTCCHPRKDIPSSPRSRKSWKSRVHWNKESRYSCECGQIACLVYWMMVGWIQNKPHPHNWAAFLCRIWHWLEYIEICEGIKKAKWAVFSHAAVELFLSMLKGKLQWTCFFTNILKNLLLATLITHQHKSSVDTEPSWMWLTSFS